jgi:hypothetical protein
MEKIEITIDVNGETEVSVSGMAGPGCKAATKGIEDALGKAGSVKLTAEHSQKAKATASRQVGN